MLQIVVAMGPRLGTPAWAETPSLTANALWVLRRPGATFAAVHSAVGYRIESVRERRGHGAFRWTACGRIISSMSTFAVVASRATPTNTRLGVLLSPAQAVARLRIGDVALGRLDVLSSLDGIEPGLWALDLLDARGVTVLNGRDTLATAHDKLATAEALACAGIPHPPSAHVAPWLPLPNLEPPLVLKPRFGSWGRDVIRCETPLDVMQALEEARLRVWFNAAGGVLQRLIPPVGYDLRIVVAGGRVAGAIMRQAAPGEWRTNVALGARRLPIVPPDDACELALAAAEAVGGDLVGVDLLPLPGGGWMVLEINGAVDFTASYSLDGEIFSTVHSALLPSTRPPAVPSYSFSA